jgi:hypothetical protein
MNWFMKITLASILALFGIGCGEKSEPKIEYINPAELQKGPIQSESLSEEQLQRIDKLRQILAEVDTQTREQWIDNFKRDLNPDKEIAIWEQIAKTYQIYCSRNNLSQEAKSDVLGVILLRSMIMNEDEVLKSAKLKKLTEAQAKEVIKLY